MCAILWRFFVWAFTVKLIDSFCSRPPRAIWISSEVESPSAGVVSKVFVKDGEEVKQGQLLDVEAKGLASRRNALETTLFCLSCGQHTCHHFAQWRNYSRIEDLPDIPVVDDPSLNAQLNTAQKQSQQFRSRLEQIATRLTSRRATLQLKEQIANDLKLLFENGAMSRNQYLLQLNQVQETRAEVATLEEERSRVIGQIASQLNQIDRQMIQIVLN